jgi:hypothetical protein
VRNENMTDRTEVMETCVTESYHGVGNLRRRVLGTACKCRDSRYCYFRTAGVVEAAA